MIGRYFTQKELNYHVPQLMWWQELPMLAINMVKKKTLAPIQKNNNQPLNKRCVKNKANSFWLCKDANYNIVKLYEVNSFWLCKDYNIKMILYKIWCEIVSSKVVKFPILILRSCDFTISFVKNDPILHNIYKSIRS